jgi:hypothetical protein
VVYEDSSSDDEPAHHHHGGMHQHDMDGNVVW